MTSAKKLLYQSIPLVIDNLCAMSHDVTISSSNVIEGAPPPRFFYLQKSPVLLGLKKISVSIKADLIALKGTDKHGGQK